MVSRFYPFIGETKVTYTPSGMWMHKVWQNSKECICSGVRRMPDGDTEYRFTVIGTGSILLPKENRYNDVFVKASEIEDRRTDSKCDPDEICAAGGWLKHESFLADAHPNTKENI